ncbi:patatin-like phospholipase family protein [Muriicola sp. Z0-33]|uniref:patatin-like phospholipase family protein n=1 Tax=Muriicola sp. Z0-33 TaxID=2816957 RepID=UPI00223829B6|nr:patatin-like phospholipase family protein [Muriicola sp. Z0-33]MCW5514910.1 patatin-like phospholipase family protein [Muriicola sp. Z0-33]
MNKKVFFIIFSLFALVSFAQEDRAKQNPKVGLVLSGGGAKGLAHIGALKVIEEAGVKIDYIGGTSMGAIIGALYASGYSASALDSIFKSTDLANLIQDNLPRSAKTFYEKEDSERYALTLPFNDFKISFPPAISGGQNIYNELVRLLYHVKDTEDFNKLPIPFFCIATDVEKGTEVLLDSGYLPEAILASGTFPSLFEPAEVDGQILIDGGVLNNYPIEEVRNLGADFIIGVDVQHGLRDRESLLSATEILLQINNYRTVGDMKLKSRLTDIYIKPDMENYSVIDFDLKQKIMETGENAARDQIQALQALALRQSIKQEPKPPIFQKDTIIVNRLVINGNNNYTRGYVKGKLRFNLAEKVTFRKLQQGISNLAATGNFQTIRYELVSNGLGEDLIIKLRENPTKTFIRIGAHYDDLYKSAAMINLTKKYALVSDDVASLDFILGDNVRYNFQYYVDKGSYWSFGINSRFNDFTDEIGYGVIQSNFDVPQDDNINSVNLDVSDFTNQIYLQTVLNEEFAFSLGVEHKFLKYSTTTLNEVNNNTSLNISAPGDIRTFFEKSNYFSTYGKLILDTYNDKYFPSKGLYFNGDFHLYLLSSDFNDNFKEFSIAKARMGMAFPIVGNLSLNVETEGGFKLGTSNVSSLDFVLGGYGNNLINNFVPFLGYDFLALPGNSYVKAYARLDLEFAPKNHLLFAANYSNVEDDLFRTGEWFTAPDYSGYGLGYGWESFFGPVQILYSWSPEVTQSNIFISVGYWF